MSYMIKVFFDNGEKKDKRQGFDMKFKGSKKECLEVLDKLRKAIEEVD